MEVPSLPTEVELSQMMRWDSPVPPGAGRKKDPDTQLRVVECRNPVSNILIFFFF